MEMTTLAYKQYTTDEQLQTLSELASTIWHECYSKILPAEQIDHMLSTEQTAEALKEQIDNGTQIPCHGSYSSSSCPHSEI